MVARLGWGQEARFKSGGFRQRSTRPWAYHPAKFITVGRIRARTVDDGDDDDTPIYTTPQGLIYWAYGKEDFGEIGYGPF